MPDEYLENDLRAPETSLSDDEPELPAVAVVPSWLQLGVIVSDGSGSMLSPLPEPDNSIEGDASITKAAAANRATANLLDRMAGSRKKAQFNLGWVSFNDKATDAREPSDAKTLRGTGSFDPTAKGPGGTRIWTGLEAAEDMVTKWFAAPEYEDIPMSAVVVLMTDGEDGDPTKTRAVAERIKSLPNTRLAACFFATRGQTSQGADFLRGIVTPPEEQYFRQVYDAEALRDFFEASVTAVV